MNAAGRLRLMPPAGLLFALGGAAFLFALGTVAPAEMRFVPVILSVALLLGVAVRWPLEVMIAGYPLIWPIAFLPIHLPGGFSVSPERILGLVVAPAFVLALMTDRLRCRPVPGPLKAAAAVLVLVHLASVLYHGGGLETGLQVVQKVALAFLAFAAVSDETSARRLVRISVLGCAGAALAIVAFVIAGGTVDALLLVRGSGNPMWAGRMPELALELDLGNTLSYAWLLAARQSYAGQFGVWLALVELATARTRGRRIAWAAVACGLLVAYTLVFRRAVFIYTVAAVAVLALHGRTKVRLWSIGILSAAALIFGLVILPASVFWQYRWEEETVVQLSEGSDPRQQLLEASWEAWHDAPVLGHGLDMYDTVMQRYLGLLTAFEPGSMIAAHNSFALVAVELGAVGLLALLLFLGALVKELWAADRSRAPGYTGQLMAMWPVLFGQVMMWWVFGSGLYLTLSWFLLGMLAGIASLANSVTAADRRRQGPAA